MGCVTGMLLISPICFFLICTKENETREDEQQKAVKAGVGGWIINSDTGESQFIYANPTDLEEFDSNEIEIIEE